MSGGRILFSVALAGFGVGLTSCGESSVPSIGAPAQFGFPLPYIEQYPLADPMMSYPMVTRLGAPQSYRTDVDWTAWLVDVALIALMIIGIQIAVWIARR